MSLYEKIKIYIDEHHLKQISVAKAANIPNTTFNAILNGKRILYADEFKAICEALNVSADFFIGNAQCQTRKIY